MKTLLGLICLLSVFVLGACSAADSTTSRSFGDGSVGVASEALVHNLPFNALQQLCPTSPSPLSCRVSGAPGPTPPADSALLFLTVAGDNTGGGADFGTYSPTGANAILHVSPGEYGFDRSVLGGLAANQYLAATISYNDSACSGGSCPLTGETYSIQTF